ncbi:GNAT family N-acetyltransferase [Allobranchiibius sp. GilTou73]|uniref:GNAT family N-acetyltransferase n=1 Tax=Allobranchiibius sp. GilTou73 TaxID=2904523 RepID=UPI001F1A996B|nr:GNAT family N-acetyltransferase [Allobranchiibius sp. GilTou73]UIJ34982.1 GNAT family N-acetyltransferase [Allobranchiibius sp. GilTou73]
MTTAHGDSGGPAIRAAATEDVPAIAALVDRMWRATYADLVDDSFWATVPMTFWAAEVRSHLCVAPTALVAIEGDDVVGWVCSGPARSEQIDVPRARSRELYTLYVGAPGHGLGQHLLDAALPNDEPAELWVFEANLAAQRFYRRNGFTPEGSRHVYLPETAALPEIRMMR